MTTTALNLITDAFLKIGTYAIGDVIDDGSAEQALIILNDMMDSWSNESLTCYDILEQSGALVIAQQSYTVGSGGNFNVIRPTRIITGPGAAYIQDSLGNNYPIDVLPRDQWNLIGNRSTNITANVPSSMFYEPSFPLGNITVFPTPNVGGYTLFFDSYLPFSDFTSLSAVFSLPPGYEKAIKDSLAIQLFPYFGTGQFSPILAEIASVSKANIKRANLRPTQAIYDPEIVARSKSTYNIYRDTQG